MNNPVPYRLYTENYMFEKERDEHGEEFFKALIDRIVFKLAGELGAYNRDKLTAELIELYSCELRIRAIKFECELGL